MPNLDGTGPKGKGPKTGRGAGNCSSGGVVPRGQRRGLRNGPKGLGLGLNSNRKFK